MEKLLGAAAEQHTNLAGIKTLGDNIRNSGRSMGMALTPCTVPHAGKPSFELPDDEIELGIGIHGEPGRRREKVKPSAVKPPPASHKNSRRVRPQKFPAAPFKLPA